MLRRSIILHVRQIADYTYSEEAGERIGAICSLIDSTLLSAESHGIREMFRLSVSKWFLAAQKKDSISFSFTNEHFEILAGILKFETGIRNNVAHSSFEYSMRGLSPLDQIQAVRVPDKKGGGNYLVSTYSRTGLIEFCRFQNFMEGWLRDHLYLLQFGPGICSAEECREMAKSGEGFGEDYNVQHNKFLTEHLPELERQRLRLLDKVKSPPSERTDGNILTPL